MYSMSPYNQIAHYCSLHKLRRSYVIMKLCIGDPARRLKLDSGRRLNGITCRRSASAQHCPFGIFYTRRPLGSEQRCLSLHRIWCPLHLLNNSMERGDISSRYNYCVRVTSSSVKGKMGASFTLLKRAKRHSNSRCCWHCR